MARTNRHFSVGCILDALFVSAFIYLFQYMSDYSIT